MNISIRMIGIATTIFWIFIILFGVSAIYSVKDVGFDFGEPQFSMTSNNEILFSIPITIVNNGLYNIGHFNATTEILDQQGLPFASGSTFVKVIGKDARVVTYHNVTIKADDVLKQGESYLFNDSQLSARETVGLWVAEVIPVQASANQSLPWGAPLYGFQLRTPQYSYHNRTYVRADVPISFENHAPFDVVGNIQIRLFSDANVYAGEGQTDIAAVQHSPYEGVVQVYVSTRAVPTSGFFEVTFTTSLFTYGPVVVKYG
jgi:hypothetical protein